MQMQTLNTRAEILTKKNATQCNYGVLTRRNKPELTDDLSQCKQTSVDMAAFFQPHTSRGGLRCTLTSRQINKVLSKKMKIISDTTFHTKEL